MQKESNNRIFNRRAFAAAPVLILRLILRLTLGPLLVLSLSFAGLVLLLSQTEQRLQAPGWVKTQVEEQLNRNFTDVAMTVSDVSFYMTRSGRPGLVLNNLQISSSDATPIAEFQEIALEFAVKPLIERNVTPKNLFVKGVVARLSRDANGRFGLAFADASASDFVPESLAQAFDAVEALLSRSVLSGIERAEVRDLELRYRDASGGSDLTVTDGRLVLSQAGPSLSMNLGFRLRDANGQEALVSLGAESQKGSQAASFGAQIDDVPAPLIAEFVPSLAWLSVVDAPISGALRSGVSADGVLANLSGTLEIGTGVVRPNQGAKPVSFVGGKAYFTYDQAARKITFNEFTVESDTARFTAEGHAYLQDFQAGVPTQLVAQLRFRDMVVNPEGWYATPLALSGGAMDIRFQFDPFMLTIGQLVLLDGDNRFHAKGEIGAQSDGWSLSLDAWADRLGHDRLIELWPLALKPKSRRWVEEHVLAGDGFNGRVAFRAQPGRPPRLAASFEFENASVKYLKGFPAAINGSGYGSLEDNVFSLTAEQGQVPAPSGQLVDVAGTVVQIADVRLKPAPGEVILHSRAPIEAVLSLMDLPPFNLLAKSQLPVDVAQGEAVLKTHLRLPFKKHVQPAEVRYAISGDILNMRSDKLVPDHPLTAERLVVRGDNASIEISGQGHLGQVPFNATWAQKIDPDGAGQGRIDGSLELSRRFVEEFRLGLPENALLGTGRAVVSIDLIQGKPGNFRLQSDLGQLALNLPSMGWSKPKSATGKLEVQGQLGPVVSVDSLTFEAPGLSAQGSVSLTEAGDLDRARFSRVRIGGWLDSPVELRGRGPGVVPSVAVLGGSADLRNASFGGGGSGGRGKGGPLSLALDRLIVSDGIVLTDVRGDFNTRVGFNGSFTGQVNGIAPIRGTVRPGQGGTAVHIQSNDAGAVFRAAGLIDKAYDGTLDLVLTPRGPQGSYNGRLTAEKLKIRGASALADLLGAISVIGLLEQLNGQGIVFSDVEADFVLTPTIVAITRSSAIGPSLGVSMDGTYDVKRKWIDMQGVISPIYLFNGIGAFLTRRGEGLFGFNFNLVGPAKAPKTQVNPLSILTPGMFREIFRRPPPTVTQ